MSEFGKSKFLIILISPSGGGKSVILRRIVKENENINYSVSYTTRKIRRNEKDGKAYHFISKDKFQRMQRNGDFLESAVVHGKWYGTSKKYIESKLDDKKLVIMDIDVQGARQIIREKIPCITIFILPPSKDVWLSRLKNRGTEDSKEIKKRLDTAETELQEIEEFQYLVINDDIETAVKEVNEIIHAEENKINRYTNIKKDFIGG